MSCGDFLIDGDLLVFTVDIDVANGVPVVVGGGEES